MASLTSAIVDCWQIVTHSLRCVQEVCSSPFIAECAHLQAKVTFLYVKTKVGLHSL